MDPKDRALIRVLQDEEIFRDLNPFARAAGLLGWTLDEVLARARSLRDSGAIRRFGAALTPAKAGFSANAMVAWEVEKEREEDAADAMAAHPRVSHCYIRPAFEGFPYKLYTMIHGNSPDDLQRIINELAEVSRPVSWRALHSLKEFKKSSPVYFPG